MTIQMRENALGYLYAGGLGTIFTTPLWKEAAAAVLVGTLGALSGLMTKFIWNLIRDWRKKRKDGSKN